MKLVFATNNQHKVEEIRVIIGDKFEISSLKEAGFNINIPEPFDTLEENASIKSRTVYDLLRDNFEIMGCFSEDTGLEVDALHGEPGVKSARYAGEHRSFEANIDKLLQKLSGNQNRKAQFRAVISLIIAGKEILFEGICRGMIITEKKGIDGFGYDPIFQPENATKTFAEMAINEKVLYSHRSKATQKLVAFLNNLETKDKS
jgi:XTP/dITP diphosphohydrolase